MTNPLGDDSYRYKDIQSIQTISLLHSGRTIAYCDW